MLCCVPKSSGPWSPLYLASYLRRPSSSSSTRTPPPTRCGPPRSSWQGRSPRPRRWASCATSRPRRVTRESVSATCRTTRLLALRSVREICFAQFGLWRLCSMLSSVFLFVLFYIVAPISLFPTRFQIMIWAGSCWEPHPDTQPGCCVWDLQGLALCRCRWRCALGPGFALRCGVSARSSVPGTQKVIEPHNKRSPFRQSRRKKRSRSLHPVPRPRPRTTCRPWPRAGRRPHRHSGGGGPRAHAAGAAPRGRGPRQAVEVR